MAFKNRIIKVACGFSVLDLSREAKVESIGKMPSQPSSAMFNTWGIPLARLSI
jgi:hypothetical protein